MSSYTRINYRQPVDFIKQDHQTTVEALKRFELKLAFKYYMGVVHYEYRQANNGQDYGTTSQDDCCVADEREMYQLQEQLQSLHLILHKYYTYPEGYTDAVYSFRKFKQLPIDWSKCSHDGFWGSDPTVERG